MFNSRKQRSKSALLLALGMTSSMIAPLTVTSPTLAQSTFSDTQGNWAQACISQLTDQRIISGYPDGTFRPSSPVTRAEFAAMVGKAFPNVSRSRSASQFVDVSSNYWAYSAISTATQTGFLSGYPGSVFKPDQNIPRAQALVALASGLNYNPNQSPTSTLNAAFDDASAIPTYAESGIAAATEQQIVVNYPNVRYLQPNQLASRAEVAAFLCQALARTGQSASVISSQYIASASNAGSGSQVAQVPAGTSIPVKYDAAKRIVVTKDETAPLTLTVSQDVRNNRGEVAIPAGSQVVGQLEPANGGSRFVAREVVIDGQRTPISATSSVISTTKDVRDPDFLGIVKDAAIGSAAAAVISGVTGDRTITDRKVLTGTVIGAAVGANRDRPIGSVIRDAALGAAGGAVIAGTTGNRTISAGKVIGAAAIGATIGGVADRSGNSVIVINPNSDLNLTLNTGLAMR